MSLPLDVALRQCERQALALSAAQVAARQLIMWLQKIQERLKA
ncbi:MAG: hypothetical protein RIS34_96 [Pseudomonadota bacterium]|jgi:hypothetical protein